MIVQNRKYSGILTFLVVPLLLSVCFVFFTCTQESPEDTFEYSMDQIDKVPRAIQKVNPEYPFSAKSRGIRARVMIRCIVDTKGIPQNVEVAECVPEDVLDIFGPPSVEAFKKWRFSPGEIGGNPVPTRVAFRLIFEMES